VSERVDYLEKLMGDNADKHAEEVRALQAAHSKHETALGKHAKECEDLKKAQTHHASLAERVEYVETALGESADKHAQEVEALRAAHEKHQAAFGKHAKEVEALKTATRNTITIAERVEYVEKMLGDSAEKHAEEIDALKTAAVKHEVAFHKHVKSMESISNHHSTIGERLDYVERLVGDSADKHAEELEKLRAAHNKHEATVNKRFKDVDGLQKASEHHASMAERIDYIEQQLGGSVDAHASEIDAVKALQSRHEKDFGRHAKELEALKASHAHHASLAERVTYVERQLGDSADTHARELEVAHQKLDHKVDQKFTELHERLASSVSELKKAHSGLASENGTLDAHHASLRERVDFLESAIGDSADRNSKSMESIEALRSAHGRHAKDMEAVRSVQAYHATIPDRLSYIEKVIGDSSEKNLAELGATHGKIEQVLNRLIVCEKQCSSLRDHREAISGLTSDKVALDAHHQAMKDRLDTLEQYLGESMDKHVVALEALKLAHTKHTKELDSFKVTHARHATLGDRLDYMEKVLGDSADKHFAELTTLKAAQAKQETAFSKEVDALKAANTRNATMAERMEYVERLLGDSADKNASELEKTHAKLEQMQGRLHATIGELKKAHVGLANEKGSLESHHATLRERVDFLERSLGDSADKHAKMLEALRESHAKHDAVVGKHAKEVEALKASQARQSTVEERLGYLEGILNTSHSKHAEEVTALKQAHGKHEEAFGRHAREAENQSRAIREMITKELDRREENHAHHHATVKERVGQLERLIGDSADKHTRELEAAKAAQSKLAIEIQARDCYNETMAERVARLEKSVASGNDRSTQELRATVAQLETDNKRIRAVREAWSTRLP